MSNEKALTIEGLAAKYNLSPAVMTERLHAIGAEPILQSPPRYDAEDVAARLAHWDEQRSEQTIRRVFIGSGRPLAERVLQEALDAARPKLKADLQGDGVELRIKRLKAILSGTVENEAPHRIRAMLQRYGAANTVDGQADLSEELAVAFEDYAGTLTRLLGELYSQPEPAADAAPGPVSTVPTTEPEPAEPQSRGTRRKTLG